MVIGVGGLLLLLSLAVPTLFPATMFWSDADAAAYDELEEEVTQSELKYKMAQQRRGAGSISDDELPPEIQEGISRLKELRAEKQAAATRPGQITASVRYTGIALLLVGVLWHYAVGDR